MQPAHALKLHAYYSNGAYGRAWGVRQVVAFDTDPERGEALVRFRGIAGTCRRKTGMCSVAAFMRWARHEVALHENAWLRVGPTPPPSAPTD